MLYVKSVTNSQASIRARATAGRRVDRDQTQDTQWEVQCEIHLARRSQLPLQDVRFLFLLYHAHSWHYMDNTAALLQGSDSPFLCYSTNAPMN